MTNDWPTGQAAFVTGAASGIGLGIARALVAAGAKVALADIDAARLVDVTQELTDAGGTVLAVPLDISDPEQWSAAADRAEEALGPISILCNNAGVNGGGLIDETPLDVWRWVFKINTEAQFIGVSTFLPRFKSRGGRAHIMNTASMAGIVPMARVGAYCASKFASFGFSMVLRDELQGADVGVSVLCPGTVATRLNVTAGEAEAKVRGEGVNTAAVEGNGALLAAGADPDRVGEQVVEAIRQRDFLIITHRDWEPLVTAVHAEIGRTFGEYENRYGADPTVPFLIQGANPITT